MNIKSRSHIPPIRWDAHACPPFSPNPNLSLLHEYKNSGVDFVSLNIGYDLTDFTQSVQIANNIHDWVNENSTQFRIVRNIEELFQCKSENILAIAFDIEGSNVLNDKIENISIFHEIGVRQLSPAYNLDNKSGGGCLSSKDNGLTTFGSEIISRCNELGIIIDCSHAGINTSMDIIEQSKHPVIFSHSNPKELLDHPRNINNKQIIACASRGGVIGINGIGIFLGNNDTSTERIVEHIDYIAQIAGPSHVGIGMDCVFDEYEVKNFAANNPDTFPANHGFNDVAIAKPRQFHELRFLLEKNGYTETDINNILGDNFLRLATKVWK